MDKADISDKVEYVIAAISEFGKRHGLSHVEAYRYLKRFQGLYHGSTVEIKEIDIAKSKPNKDFGRGFYLSADRLQAQRLAEYKAYQIGGNPVVNVYDFDERLLTDGTLKVRRFDSYSKDWAEFIFANRQSKTGESVHDYDVVIGPIANDKVGVQVRKYFDKEITLETFLENLKYMKGITFQYFFGTEKAIKYLRKL